MKLTEPMTIWHEYSLTHAECNGVECRIHRVLFSVNKVTIVGMCLKCKQAVVDENTYEHISKLALMLDMSNCIVPNTVQ